MTQAATYATLTPFYKLLIDGYELGAPLQRRVESIRIQHRHQKSMMVTIKIMDEKLQFVDLDIWSKGTKWILYCGWKENFRPFGPLAVESYQMHFSERNICEITVNLRDHGRLLMKTCKWRTWNNATIGDVAKQIAVEHDLGFKIEGGEKIVFSDELPLQQTGISDALLLSQLAERFGYRFVVEDGNIVFTQRQENEEFRDELDKHVLAWRVAPRTLMSFTPAQKTYGGPGKGKGTTGQSGATKCVGNVDIAKGSEFQGHIPVEDAAEELDGAPEAIANGGVVTPTADTKEGNQTEVAEDIQNAVRQEIQAFWQVGRRSEEANRYIEATFANKDGGDRPQTEEEVKQTVAAATAGRKSDTAFAKAVLKVADMHVKQGDLCEVIGVGQRFSGEWRITEWEHTLNNKGLFTTLWLGKKGLGASSDTGDVEDAGDADNTGGGENQPAYKRAYAVEESTSAAVGGLVSGTGFQKVSYVRVQEEK